MWVVWAAIRLAFYGSIVMVTLPLILVLGRPPRVPSPDDGLDLGDDDPGEDVDA